MIAQRWMPGDLEEIAAEHKALQIAPDVTREVRLRTFDFGEGPGVIPVRLDSSWPPRGTRVGRAIWRAELERWDVLDDRWAIKSWARTFAAAERVVLKRVRCTSRVEASRAR